MQRPHYAGWREPLTFFLDDGFDCDESYSILIDAGLKVERFSDHFPGMCGCGRQQGIPDGDVIQLCDRNAWILLTLDHNIISTHRAEIARSKHFGVLASAHNTVADPKIWAEAVVTLKPKLEKKSFNKKQRPWFAKFDKGGGFTKPPAHLLDRRTQRAGEKMGLGRQLTLADLNGDGRIDIVAPSGCDLYV